MFRVPTRTLWRHIERHLRTLPPHYPSVCSPAIFLKVDATHLGRWGCITVYKAGTRILYWQFSVREDYDTYCKGILWLLKKGYTIKGVTSDWHAGIVAAVKTILPQIPHQRCLVHTQRLALSYITTRSKTEAGQDLRRIVLELNKLHTMYEARIWERWLTTWEKRYKELLKERTYGQTNDKRSWWYTHKYLRRAYRIFTSSPNNLFLYLTNQGLPKDTNSLEAEFTHLKDKLRIHHGLKRKKRVALIQWYFFFKSMKKPTESGN